MALADEPRLGCGRPIDQVWERIGLPPDAHEVSCPDCQRARESLTQLTLVTDELRHQQLDDPELQPEPELKNSIMSLARAEVRRGQMLPLRYPSRADAEPELSISEQAVASVVRAAADQLSGLRARRCRVRIETATPAGEQVDPVRVRVDLSVAVSVTAQVPALTADLRRRVTDLVAAETGLSVRRLDVEVEDLFDA